MTRSYPSLHLPHQVLLLVPADLFRRHGLAESDAQPARAGESAPTRPGVIGAVDGHGHERHVATIHERREAGPKRSDPPVVASTPFGKHEHDFVSLQPSKRLLDPSDPASVDVDRIRSDRADKPAERRKIEQARSRQKVRLPWTATANKRRIKMALMVGQKQHRPLRRDVLHARRTNPIDQDPKDLQDSLHETIPDSAEERSLGHGVTGQRLGIRDWGRIITTLRSPSTVYRSPPSGF